MAFEINQNGVSVEEFSTIYERLETGLKDIYGVDIDLDQESIDGQLVRLISQGTLDLQAAIALIATSVDPDVNTGLAQYIIGKIAGIPPRPATRSQRDLKLTLSAPFTLYAGYTVKDQDNQNWVITNEQKLVAGENTVTFYAETWGAVTGFGSDTFEEVTPELEITTVEASGDVLVGTAQETNEAYRQRRNRSVQNPATGTVGALYAKIAAMTDVTDLMIYENDTDVYDSEKNINPHTVWVVCEGGDVNAIAEVMVKQRTAGSGTKGDVTGVYVEERVRPSGNILTINHEMNLDRPEYVDLYVRLTATRTIPTQAFDESLIKENLASADYEIGDTVTAGSLYCAALTNNSGYYYVTDLEISLDGENWTDESLFSGYGGKFVVSVDNITVNEG